MRYVLVKCSFEKLLEVAEKLKHKMPIAENDLNSLKNSINKTNLIDHDDFRKNLEENCFKEFWNRIKYLDRFQPKEIKRYYYEADASMLQHEKNLNKGEEEEDEMETNLDDNLFKLIMRKKRSEVNSRKYFTAPYLSQMKEKFVTTFNCFLT